MTENCGSLKLIRADRLIDGLSKKVLEKAAVLVEGSTIIAVGRESEIQFPEGREIQQFDYTNTTMLPGLVDTHVHMNWFGDGRPGDEIGPYPVELLMLQSARNMKTHLESGVTTVRDCGSKYNTAFYVKEAVRLGIAPGPRMLVCGRPITITGGHLWYMGSEANGEIAVTEMVRQLVKEGADFIKIIATGGSTRTSVPFRPSFNQNEIKAMVNEAHKFGKLTAAHCVGTEGILNALESGIDTIIHCRFFEPDGTPTFRPDIAEIIAKKGIWVDATVAQAWARQLALETKEVKGEILTEIEINEIQQIKESREIQRDHFQRMLNMGVKMVSGSDSAWMHYKMGGFQYEIIGHAEWGMGNMDAIISGTGSAADCIGLGDTIGTLEVGKEADLLLVEGDPSTNIWDLLKVKDVFLAGAKI